MDTIESRGKWKTSNIMKYGKSCNVVGNGSSQEMDGNEKSQKLKNVENETIELLRKWIEMGRD